MLKHLIICGALLMGGTACVEHTSCKKDSMENITSDDKNGVEDFV